MATKKQMLSVAEVREMVAPDPGDKEAPAVWINPGVTGVLLEVNATQTKKRQNMFICTLGDLTGSAEISMTLFDRCEWAEGDVLEIFGKGLRRTVYNDLEQISLGRETEIHKLGTSAHGRRGPSGGSQANREPTRAPAGGAPATERGAGFHGNDKPQGEGIYGGTVGMAMKEAMLVHTRGLEGDKLADALSSTHFWGAVHETASDVIRISLLLEKGKMAPSVRERNRSPEEKEAEEKAAAEKLEAERLEKERLAAELEEKRKAAAAKSTPAKDDGEDGLPY